MQTASVSAHGPQRRKRPMPEEQGFFSMQVQPRKSIGCLKDLLAGIGHNDLGLFGKVDIRSTALDAASDDSDFVSRLQSRLIPAELFNQSRRASKLCSPANRCARLVGHIHNDHRMGIDELKFN